MSSSSRKCCTLEQNASISLWPTWIWHPDILCYAAEAMSTLALVQKRALPPPTDRGPILMLQAGKNWNTEKSAAAVGLTAEQHPEQDSSHFKKKERTAPISHSCVHVLFKGSQRNDISTFRKPRSPLLPDLLPYSSLIRHQHFMHVKAGVANEQPCREPDTQPTCQRPRGQRHWFNCKALGNSSSGGRPP